jgi:hypothetical protein
MLSIFAGLFAGALHVFSGPDHLAAIAPMSAQGGKGAARLGFRWGLGHSGGVVFVGLATLLFREFFDVAAFASDGEWLVGITLIGIGLLGFRQSFSSHVRDAEHEHGPLQHAHIHVTDGRKSHGHNHAAFAIGTLHGLAGSSHILGVVPALALPTIADAMMFLGAYGIGTILAMTLFAAGLGRLGSSSDRLTKPLFTTCSAAALVIGCSWLFL